MTDAEYVEFLASLKREYQLLDDKKTFKALNELPMIMEKLKGMIEENYSGATSYFGLEVPDFRSRLYKFLGLYFNDEKNPEELLMHFQVNSGNFFTLKKGYQLSHATGLYRNVVLKAEGYNDDIMQYYKGRLFIDQYETLPVLLHPILMSLPNKLEKIPQQPNKKGKKEYETICSHLDLGKNEDINHFVDLRHNFSHSNALFLDDQFEFWKRKGKPQKLDFEEINQKMDLMANLLVLFATEIDLRILAQANSGNDKIFPLWMEYFEIYVTWFHKNLGRPKPQA